MKMSNQFTAAFRAQSKQRACVSAILVGSMLILPGCKIPALRRALPAQALPQHYSLNNGAVLWSHETGSHIDDLDNGRPADATDSNRTTAPENETGAEGDAAESGDKTARLKSFFSPIKLASLVKSDSNDTDNPHEKATAPGAVASVGKDDNPTSTAVAAASTDDTADTPIPILPPIEMEAGVTSVESSAQLPLNQFFDDPFLIGLINQALAGNQELKILAEEINISNNEVFARSGEYRPFVTLGAGAGIEKSSRFSRDGAVEDLLQAAPGRGFPEPLPDFLVGANVSWELDIWNKLRNAQSAACMRYLGSREGRNYIVTRMVAEVAESYYELLAFDNRLMTLEKTIEIQEHSLEIAKAKKAAGRGTELAVQRFQAEVRKNQSDRLIIQQEIVEAENRINFLLGRYPQPVERASVEYIDLNLNALSAGLPSQLLQNRADIRQAERNVAAAGLDVQVARARFYPSLGLRAGVGLNAFNMKYLLSTPESLIYNATLDLVGPLINKRAIKADYCSANAAQLQAIYDYQQTVLTAHIEVVNHMTKVENYRQSIEIKKQQLAALEASVDTASKLFQNARAEYVEVLLAQREMMEARMLLIETKQQQLAAVVNAYQALGGGGF
ncbi:Cation efflux system protein CusC precursor [Fuerstiella marisgermanici]|uniref:Cation efflux system protein CusC n=2 Tax=Fuerstiella marisgermanici TaxID=1891926 RepID=A0A1P8WIL1_9PLAN|nr:Cation efflux system protein CusC precursor [Fuerstiella marisgermanici]